MQSGPGGCYSQFCFKHCCAILLDVAPVRVDTSHMLVGFSMDVHVTQPHITLPYREVVLQWHTVISLSPSYGWATHLLELKSYQEAETGVLITNVSLYRTPVSSHDSIAGPVADGGDHQAKILVAPLFVHFWFPLTGEE
jgi:hypothetical protein